MTARRAMLSFAVCVLCAAAGISVVPAALSGSVVVTVRAVQQGKPDEPVIGATVELTDPIGRSPVQARTTNAEGRATFESVAGGIGYVVVVTSPGYTTVRQPGVRVAPGTVSEVRVKVLASLHDEVVVVNRTRAVEMEQTAQGRTELGREALADLPMYGRDYQNLLTIAPGVQDSNHDGNPTIHGSREQDFRLTVDGVSNVDPLTGKFLSYVNVDAIEEMEVLDSGADASYGGATGGFGRIITKSGTNRLEGTLKLFLRDSAFDKQAQGTSRHVPYREIQPALFLAGPVLRDRLWFALDHERIATRRPQSGGFGSTYVEEANGWRHADKLTWLIDPRNRLVLDWRSDPKTVGPLGLDNLTSVESGYEAKNGGPTTSLHWMNAWSPATFFDTTVAFSDVHRSDHPTTPGAFNHCMSRDPAAHFTFLGGYFCTDDTTNGSSSGPYNIDKDQKHQRWSYHLEGERYVDHWLGGSHRIKFGGGLERARFERDVTVSPRMDLSIQTQRVPPIFDSSEDVGPEGGGGGVAPYVLHVSSYYFPGQGDISLTDPDHPYLLHPQRGLDTSLGNYYNAYLSDTWQPSERLSVTLGLRLQREELRSDGYDVFDPAAERAAYVPQMQSCGEQCNVCRDVPINRQASCFALCVRLCGSRAQGDLFTIHPLDDPRLVSGGTDQLTCSYAINPVVCNRLEQYLGATGLFPDVRQVATFGINNTALAPRVAVNWDPLGKGKTRVFASWGRYYGDTFLDPLLLENGPDTATTEYRVTTDREVQDTSNLPAPVSNIDSAFSIHTVDRHLKMQHDDEFSAGFEHEIAPETVLGVRYVNRKYRDQFQDRDINHVPITAAQMRTRPFDIYPVRRECPMVDGYYDCSGVYVAPSANPTPFDPPAGMYPDGLPDVQVLNPYFNNIYQIGNYNSSDYEAAIVEFKKRWYQNWEMSASYTWSRSMGDAEDFNSDLGNDITAHDHERGRLATDQPHVFKLSAHAFVPRLGGFHVGSVLTYQSGLPYSVVERRAVLDFPTDLTEGTVASINSWAASNQLPWRINTPTMYFVSERLIFVDGKRNDQRNPGYWTLDLNAQKDFKLGDTTATVQLEIFNALNEDTRQILEQRRSLRGRKDDGTLLYNVLPPSVSSGQPRRFQLALKLRL